MTCVVTGACNRCKYAESRDPPPDADEWFEKTDKLSELTLEPASV